MLLALKTSLRAFIQRVAGLRAGAGAELRSRTDSPAGERPIRKPRGTIKIFSRGGTRSGYCSNFATFNCECPHPEESSFSTFLDCNTPGAPGSHTPVAFPACWDSHMPALRDPAVREFHCFNIAYEHSTIPSPSLKRSKLLLPKIPGFQASSIPTLSPNTLGSTLAFSNPNICGC